MNYGDPQNSPSGLPSQITGWKAEPSFTPEKRLKEYGSQKNQAKVIGLVLRPFWDGLKTKSVNTPSGINRKKPQNPRRKLTPKIQNAFTPLNNPRRKIIRGILLI
uniref:hypothetical protein n=2 Tax=Providencia TaxID=586 RepID=UPI001F396254